MVAPATEEVPAVVLPASKLNLRASAAVGSRAYNRTCHHVNAVVLANVSDDCVIDAGGGNSSGVCDILPPQDRPLPPRLSPCLSCSAGVCG